MGSPGKSFVKMFDLLYVYNKYAWRQFSDRLMIAICWEETLFNNVYQAGPNTAVGFGQTEPSEFGRFREFALTPPPTKKIPWGKGTKTIATRPLLEAEAIQAMSVLLASIYNAKGSVETCLRSYAGYYWALEHPELTPNLPANKRLQIIQRWRNCEAALKSVKPYLKPTRAEEDVIIKALQMARPFEANVFRARLFPPGDYA